MQGLMESFCKLQTSFVEVGAQAKFNNAISYAMVTRTIANFRNDLDEIGKADIGKTLFQNQTEMIGEIGEKFLTARDVIDTEHTGDTRDVLASVEKNNSSEIDRCSNLFVKKLLTKEGIAPLVGIYESFRKAYDKLREVPVAARSVIFSAHLNLLHTVVAAFENHDNSSSDNASKLAKRNVSPDYTFGSAISNFEITMYNFEISNFEITMYNNFEITMTAVYMYFNSFLDALTKLSNFYYDEYCKSKQ